MPQSIPYSRLQNRQVSIVTRNGNRSASVRFKKRLNNVFLSEFLSSHSLFDFHISEIRSNSTRDIMAAIISAASVVLGIK